MSNHQLRFALPFIVAALGTAACRQEPENSVSVPGSGGAASGASNGSGGTSILEGGAPALGGTGGGEKPGDFSAQNSWILEEFAAVPAISGDFSARQNVEMPTLILDSTATSGKYAFAFRDDDAPVLARAAVVGVTITDLASDDIYGAGLSTSRNFPGVELFLSDVYIEPNWPLWESYDTTNYDGIVLDGSEAIYAEDLTVKNWNADAALDIKSNTAQFVRLTTEGPGHRTLRFWRTGPHYLVSSDLNNDASAGEGSLLWISDCDATKIFIFETTFNGASGVPADKISCDMGNNPELIYLKEDPRTTGEMHPMFSAD